MVGASKSPLAPARVNNGSRKIRPMMPRPPDATTNRMMACVAARFASSWSRAPTKRLITAALAPLSAISTLMSVMRREMASVAAPRAYGPSRPNQ